MALQKRPSSELVLGFVCLSAFTLAMAADRGRASLHVYLRRGGHYTISCTSNTLPVLWHRILIGPSVVSTNDTLDVHQIHLSNKTAKLVFQRFMGSSKEYKVYHCQQSEAEVYLVDRGRARLHVYLRRGGRYTINCTSHTPPVLWRSITGRLISTNDTLDVHQIHLSTKTATLVIQNLMGSPDVYYCQQLEAKFYLAVPPADIVLSPYPIATFTETLISPVFNTTQLYMSCKYNRFIPVPQPVTSWFVSLRNGSSFAFDLFQPYAWPWQVPLNRNFNGNYTCVVSNVAGRLQKTTQLIIQHPPEVSIMSLGTTYDGIIRQGDHLHLQCSVKAIPSVTKVVFYFMKNAMSVMAELKTFALMETPAAERTTVEMDISNSQQEEQSGVYTCRATNAIGTTNASQPISITVIAQPTAPQNFTYTKASQSITLLWQEPKDNGNSPITGYFTNCTSVTSGEDTVISVLMVNRTNKKSSNSTDGDQYTVNVTDLKHGTNYTCTVFATNHAGNGTASTSVMVALAPVSQLTSMNTTQNVTNTATTPGPVVSHQPQGATPGVCDCSGNGVCERNASHAYICRCHKGFHGEHCQCADNKCPRVNNQPCGGQANGQCSCSVKGLQSCSDCSCTCNPGYMLNSRTNTCCPISNDACRKTIASLVCSGNGKCNSGSCECFGTWQGKYCDSCVADEDHCPTLCHLGLSCAQAPAECVGKRCCHCSGNVRPAAGGICNVAAGCHPIRCSGVERLAKFPKSGSYVASVIHSSSPNTARTVEYRSCPVQNGQCLTVSYVAKNPYDTSQFLPLVTYTNPECSRSSAARLISQFPVIPFVIFFTFLKESCLP